MPIGGAAPHCVLLPPGAVRQPFISLVWSRQAAGDYSLRRPRRTSCDSRRLLIGSNMACRTKIGMTP